MKRTIYCLFGAGLIVLWAIGMTRSGTAGWIASWLDALAAVWAFTLAVSCHDQSEAARQNRLVATVCLAVGLYALWALTLLAEARPWIAWWNAGFATLFLASTAVPERFRRREAAPVVPFRKSA